MHVKQALRPAHRLRRSTDFPSLLNTGSRHSDASFSLFYRPNERRFPRLGLAVSKRVVRHATARNVIKRQLREAFRSLIGQLPSIDIVVLLRPRAADMAPDRLRARVTQAMLRIAGTGGP